MQEKVIKILMDYMDVEREFITLNSKFERDFGMDSLDFMEMIVSVENATNIGVDQNNISDIETVYDLIEYLEEMAI
jgi:acyl carrier protein